MSFSSNGQKAGVLYTETHALKEISKQMVDQLYTLYANCYDHTDRERFYTDISEKHWVILLRDTASQEVIGFSTQMVMRVFSDNSVPVRALFSGDTVVHPAYWGNQALVRAWCRLAGYLKAQAKDELFYWFLISKGYRTYRYMPLFFKRFYPNYKTPTPLLEQKLIWVLGNTKYSERFSPMTGLVEHNGIHDRLKPALDKTLHRLNNPHVAYFVETNPLYEHGTELLCVSELSASNMRSIACQEFKNGLADNRLVTPHV